MVIDTVLRNSKHVDYRLEGEVLKKVCDVNGCSLNNFSEIIRDHVKRRYELIKRAVKQLT